MNKHPYIVAEIGGNHNGDIELGKRMIVEAKACGADAVKFQLYRRCDLWTNDHLKELDAGVVKLENVAEWTTKELGLSNIFEQIDRFAIQEQEHIELFNCARELGIDYGTSTFTKKDVDFCIDQKVANLKVASCDATNLDLIEYVISKDYPVHIALGMVSMDEIREVANVIPKGCRHNVTLLHCVSLYPPKDSQVNLEFMNTLRREFGMAVGYSDHTLGYAVPLAAAALGAEVIEKHFTLDKNMPGWDHKVSANPEELRIICEMSKRIADSLGDGVKVLCDDEIAKRRKFMRTIATARSIKAGATIAYEDIAFKRPGTGICASKYRDVIGKKAVRDIEADKTLYWEDVQI